VRERDLGIDDTTLHIERDTDTYMHSQGRKERDMPYIHTYTYDNALRNASLERDHHAYIHLRIHTHI
jgi:hypothetical protein